MHAKQLRLKRKIDYEYDDHHGSVRSTIPNFLSKWTSSAKPPSDTPTTQQEVQGSKVPNPRMYNPIIIIGPNNNTKCSKET